MEGAENRQSDHLAIDTNRDGWMDGWKRLQVLMLAGRLAPDIGTLRGLAGVDAAFGLVPCDDVFVCRSSAKQIRVHGLPRNDDRGFSA
jgi:hypothetical protein